MVHCTKKWIRALQKKICINFASLRRKHKDLPHLNLFWQWWLLLIFEISNHFHGVLVNAAAWASLEDFLLTKCMHLEWVSHFCLKCLWILSKKYALFLESKESPKGLFFKQNLFPWTIQKKYFKHGRKCHIRISPFFQRHRNFRQNKCIPEVIMLPIVQMKP